MGEDIRREKENESSARQVKVRGKDRNPHAERETKTEEIRKEIHEMNLVLWGFVLNLGGSGSEKVRGKKGTQEDSVGPESQSSASAQSVPSVSFHGLGSLAASGPTPFSFPEDTCTHPSHGTRTSAWPVLGVVSGEPGFQFS